MKRIFFILFLAFFSLNSYAQSSNNRVQPIEFNENVFITIYVDAKGKVLVDGKKTKLKKLPQLFTELTQKKGFIKFSKAQVNKEVVAQTNSEIFKLLKKTGITVRVFTDKTFQKELLL